MIDTRTTNFSCWGRKHHILLAPGQIRGAERERERERERGRRGVGVGCEIDSIRVLSIVYRRIERVKPPFFRLLTRDLIFCTTFLGEREKKRERGKRERER